MGMYTQLIVRCKLKPEFIEPVKKLLSQDAYTWTVMAQEGNYEWMEEFARNERAGAIPFCESSYFESYPNTVNDERVWSFGCNLKNYEDTIEEFLTMLPHMIVELYECKTLYEEAGTPTDHHLVDGKITNVKSHGTGDRYE